MNSTCVGCRRDIVPTPLTIASSELSRMSPYTRLLNIISFPLAVAYEKHVIIARE